MAREGYPWTEQPRLDQTGWPMHSSRDQSALPDLSQSTRPETSRAFDGEEPPAQGLKRAVLIPAHQPRVTHDICRKDGRQSPYTRSPVKGLPHGYSVRRIVRGLVRLGNDEECRRDSQPQWISGRGSKTANNGGLFARNSWLLLPPWPQSLVARGQHDNEQGQVRGGSPAHSIPKGKSVAEHEKSI